MTEKQKLFCDEYLIDMNGTRAYKTVYSNVKNDNVASSCANKLLKKAEIKNYIEEQLNKISSEKIADAKEVMEYLTSVLRCESISYEIVIEGIGDGCSAARIMEKPPSEKERTKAAELLGKRYSLFSDNVNVAGSVPVTIVEDLDDDD